MDEDGPSSSKIDEIWGARQLARSAAASDSQQLDGVPNDELRTCSSAPDRLHHSASDIRGDDVASHHQAPSKSESKLMRASRDCETSRKRGAS
jgi:hypothetical protein